VAAQEKLWTPETILNWADASRTTKLLMAEGEFTDSEAYHRAAILDRMEMMEMMPGDLCSLQVWVAIWDNISFSDLGFQLIDRGEGTAATFNNENLHQRLDMLPLSEECFVD
jgi:hypothetical protein